MTPSTNFTDVAALRAYVETFSDQLISRAYYGNKTAQLVTAHDGVKGKKILNLLTLGTIGRRYDKAFNPVAGTLVFSPRTLSVEAGKFELGFVPQEFESSYMGQFRKTSFNNTEEIPFEGFIMNAVMAKQANEIENAMWRAVAATSPASSDTLLQLFDGYLTLITKDLAATTPKLDPVITPTGAITAANAVALLESMFDQVLPEYQDMPMSIFVSPQVFSKYNRNHRADFSKYTVDANNNSGRITLDFCDAEIIRTPGMGTSSRVLMTPKENLHYGYDGVDDATHFNFEKDHREMHFYADFKIGVQIGLLEQGIVVVNDLP